MTRIDQDGGPAAVLVHDPAVLDDRALVEAVAIASRLAAANARLQRGGTRATDRARCLTASSAPNERRRASPPGAPCSRHGRAAAAADRQAARPAPARPTPLCGSPPRLSTEPLASSNERLRSCSSSRAGSIPRSVTERGLEPALTALAEQCPVPVALALTGDRLPEEVEADHLLPLLGGARECREVRVRLERRRVAGRGDRQGAGRDRRRRGRRRRPGAGSGLRGLADRLEALGGTLRVESPPGAWDAGDRRGSGRGRRALTPETPVRGGMGSAAPRASKGLPASPLIARGPWAGSAAV